MLLKTNKHAKDANVLVRLSEILKEIQPQGITHWVLQWIELILIAPTIIDELFPFSSLREIEAVSEIDRGFMMNNREFMMFVTGIHDILQGTFIALTDKESIHPKFILENADSSFWFLETNDKEIIHRLVSFGWEESLDAPCRSFYDLVID